MRANTSFWEKITKKTSEYIKAKIIVKVIFGLPYTFSFMELYDTVLRSLRDRVIPSTSTRKFL